MDIRRHFPTMTKPRLFCELRVVGKSDANGVNSKVLTTDAEVEFVNVEFATDVVWEEEEKE